jgi:hypothetical protein
MSDLKTEGEYIESKKPYFEMTIINKAAAYKTQESKGRFLIELSMMLSCFLMIKKAAHNKVATPITAGITGIPLPLVYECDGKE